MTFRIAFVAVLFAAILTSCADRNRVPCEAIVTIARTKNKALGYVGTVPTIPVRNGVLEVRKCA